MKLATWRSFRSARAGLALLLLAALPCPELTAQEAGGALGLHLTDCTLGASKVAARCGTFVVYEDRAARSGRTTAIPLIVIPARHRSNRAVFWNPGGPGAGAVDFAERIVNGVLAKDLMQLHDRYDIVLANNRGVGGADTQQCDLAPADHPEYYFLQLWPDALLKSCRDRLASKANLSLYSSTISADDLDDMRAALSYPKIVLNGDSYGTYFFMIYVHRHPEHVESVVLDGVAPPGLLVIPLEDAAGAQLAMDQLIAACRADAACHKRFPQLAAHFAAVSHRFDKGPLEVRIENPATKRPQVVRLSKEVFADRLRQTLYSTDAAAYVPFAVENAYRGDYVPLGRIIDTTTRSLGGLVNLGLNLSVTCAEDIPAISEEMVRDTSARSFEGDVRVRAQQRACRIWNVKPDPARVAEPVRSTLPVLMISGTDDPASPPAYAAQELKYLPNGKRILVKGAAHVTETDCTNRLKVAFVLAGSAQGLDAGSCSGAFRRPPFAMSMDGFS